MTLRFSCEVAFRVKCSRCEVSSEPEYFKLYHQGEMPYPALPEGWHVLDGQPVCDRHEVAVRDRKEPALTHKVIDQVGRSMRGALT
jgi:hypothetical protein